MFTLKIILMTLVLWAIFVLATAEGQTLREKQVVFTTSIAALIIHMNKEGYGVTFGEAWALRHYHQKRLAIDLNLFKDGKYLDRTSDHKKFGFWWIKRGKDLGVDFTWGGNFSDGNHYSMDE